MKTMVYNGLRYAPHNGHGHSMNCPEHYNGFYKCDARGIHLYTPDGTLEAYVVNNAAQGYFAVSTGLTPTGRPFYLQSTCSTTERWLGIDTLGYLAQHDAVKAISFVDSEASGPSTDGASVVGAALAVPASNALEACTRASFAPASMSAAASA